MNQTMLFVLDKQRRIQMDRLVAFLLMDDETDLCTGHDYVG